MLREGRPVLERYWAPYTAEDRVLVYSASKTFTATAVGLAVAEGSLALDDRLVDLLPEEAAGTSGSVPELTVHHLLSMSTGHDADTLAELELFPAGEWARRFLAIEPQTPVGSRHVYNNGASWLLGELVRRRTGSDLLEYLRPRLLEPLGIEATWDTDELGRCLGWTGLHVRTRDLAAIGELYRCDGVWLGRRLLPEGWVERATAVQIPTVEPNPEWCHGYGYQLWLGGEGYRLDGAYGQFSLVLPERGLVIAITSAQSENQALLDLVRDVLLPGLEAGVASAGVGADASPTLALPSDSGSGEHWTAAGPVPAEAGLASTADEQRHLPDLADLDVRREPGGFRVGVTIAGQRVELDAGSGGWLRQRMRVAELEVPLAVAAGSGADGSLQLRLVFTDSPHTLRVVVRPDGGSGQAWPTIPLESGQLAGLVAR